MLPSFLGVIVIVLIAIITLLFILFLRLRKGKGIRNHIETLPSIALSVKGDIDDIIQNRYGISNIFHSVENIHGDENLSLYQEDDHIRGKLSYENSSIEEYKNNRYDRGQYEGYNGGYGKRTNESNGQSGEEFLLDKKLYKVYNILIGRYYPTSDSINPRNTSNRNEEMDRGREEIYKRVKKYGSIYQGKNISIDDLVYIVTKDLLYTKYSLSPNKEDIEKALQMTSFLISKSKSNKEIEEYYNYIISIASASSQGEEDNKMNAIDMLILSNNIRLIKIGEELLESSTNQTRTGSGPRTRPVIRPSARAQDSKSMKKAQIKNIFRNDNRNGNRYENRNENRTNMMQTGGIVLNNIPITRDIAQSESRNIRTIDTVGRPVIITELIDPYNRNRDDILGPGLDPGLGIGLGLMDRDLHLQEILWQQLTNTVNLKDVKSVYEDTQNTHNSSINNSVLETGKWLVDTYGSKYGSLDVSYQLLSSLSPNDKAKAEKSIHRITTDSSTFKYGLTLYKVYQALLAFIRDNQYRTELEKRLLEELVEMSGLCATGHLSRLINVTSGYIHSESSSIGIKLDPKDEIFTKVKTNLQNLLTLDENEEIMDGMISTSGTGKDAFYKFCRDHSLSQLDGLVHEYRGIITPEEVKDKLRDALRKFTDNKTLEL